MTYDFVIVGAGISGLGLAHLGARHGLRTLILETDSRIGGSIATQNFSDTNGFWVEAGAHTCYNSYGNLLKIINELKIESQLKLKVRVDFKLLRQDRLRSIITGLHPLELAWHLPRLGWEIKSGRSIKDYYSSVLGSRNYQDLFGPAFNAVICQPADNFPAELLFRPKPRRKDIPRSFTFPRGLSSISEAITNQPNLEVRKNTQVIAIEQEVGGFKAITIDGNKFSARNLALAVPPDQAASIVAGNFPELAGLLGDIPMAEITSVSIAVPNKFADLPLLAGIIAPYAPFYSAVSRDYFPHSSHRGFTFHFPKDKLDSNRQLACIREVLKLPKDKLTPIHYTNHRLPALRANHVERVGRIDRVLAGTGLMLTGNYFLGVSIEDCLTRSYNEWQRLAIPGG